MAEPPSKRVRYTPRKSGADDRDTNKRTPFTDLHNLANVIRNPATPSERASSRQPASAFKIPVRTPGSLSRGPRTISRSRLQRSTKPTTPHAIRAYQQRIDRAGTPGRDRRKSGRLQRETPRDTLRNLSRLLAARTAPIEPSPAAIPSTKRRRNGFEDFFDEPDEAPPRLSLPLNALEDDDSFHEKVPRFSVNLDEDEEDDDEATVAALSQSSAKTARSARDVEMGRRQDLSRFSLGGLALETLSDRFGDMEEYEMDEQTANLTGVLEHIGMEDTQAFLEEIGAMEDDDTTQQVQAILRRESRLDAERRSSSPSDGNTTTFQFRVPERRQESPQPESPAQSDPGGFTQQDETQLSEGDSDGSEMVEEVVSASLNNRIPTPQNTHFLVQDDAMRNSPERSPVKRGPEPKKISKFGKPYGSFPPSVIKRLATATAKSCGIANGKLGKDTLLAISQASDWFFEQVAEDLASYADHAGRKTIEESDMLALMRRQRQTSASNTPFSLAQRFLPRELIQEIRMTAPIKARKRKKNRMATITEEPE
ncbi:hypothetical protein P152DRAFT_484232 [Eremomyces bilateralis CBS 781.70]|uniref:CENP-T/Histone H4 histone fold domain-containing protein n=1 Tax=Eremomyces bilateralis CBS 781.70 TaxID=1392243 RepID=A0A6G1FVM6_9PEZI|nr:uncharacterized protein P152DRAFT_484232 [Eremomyces bilateralis CBS 781.70]KAF1809877.1 hypothetical protein P152DRAFT_484232 [Eremomyces bilateralis CBS 781.70]